MDFTLEMYDLLCSTLVNKKYNVLTVNEYMTSSAHPEKTALLRHDVDRRPTTALRMARLENQKGLKASYYFRYMRGVFNPDIIHEIKAMGHEIGYHYETLSKCRGDLTKAVNLFTNELEEFRKICSVNTVSMHGRPLLPWDNRNIWQHSTLEQFGLNGECYLSLDYQKIQYFSDTGRTWLPGKHNIRDHVETSQKIALLSTSKELIKYLAMNTEKSVCILTHPNRWSNGPIECTFSSLTDLLINMIKKIVILSTERMSKDSKQSR